MDASPPSPYQHDSPLSPVGGSNYSDSSRDSFPTKIRAPTKATRRIRGEIACAECRRLKIRCDKTVPCSTCVKRGCGALCPNGTIPPGEGSRFVLAATDHLRHKLTRLEARMRSLEDALSIIHSSESDQPHPLLALQDDAEDEEMQFPTAVSDDEPKSSLTMPDAPGTLCVDAQGVSRFFGPSGGTESLLTFSELDAIPHAMTGPHLQDLDPSYLSPEINHCYQSFPFTPPNVIVSSVQRMIESFLPSMDRAITLCDTFLENLSWMFSIVSRQNPHDLALLLVVLAIGSLVDLNLPPYNLEAQHYFRLCRATLALQPVLGAQSIVTIKVLHLMSIYNGMSGKESNLEQSYVLLDLAGQVALRIGFHVDPSMWGFEGREAYDRRVYFWNLMSGVLWQSLVIGRPPSLLMSYIDCRIPTVEDENIFHENGVPLGFGIWGFRATAECLVPVARALLAAKPPSYETITDLDRKIRELIPPRSDLIQNHTDRTEISMRIFMRSHYQELMLMFLHRGHFAQAMSEFPDHPMSSPYSQSVTAAYSSACVVLEDTRTQFMRKPLLCARVWRIWSFTFSAAIIVGTIAIRGIHLNLKPPPLEEFEAICKTFSRAAETSSRAARALPVLQAMLQKAYQAQKYYHEQGKPAPANSEGVDELSYFVGRTTLIKQDEPPSSVPPLSPFSSNSSQGSEQSMASTTPTKQTLSPTSIKPQIPIPNSATPLTFPASSTFNSDFFSNVPPDRHSRPRPILPPLSIPMFLTPQHQTFAEISRQWDALYEVPSASYRIHVTNTDQVVYSRLSPHGASSAFQALQNGSTAAQRGSLDAMIREDGVHQQALVDNYGVMLDNHEASVTEHRLSNAPGSQARWQDP